MADNVTFTSTNPAGPPNATVQRTDDLGAAGHVPYAKLMDGTDNSSTVIAAGGGVESGALRVTLASDSTGLVSVDDNGGTLTVDAPVGTPVFVRLSDGSSAIATLPVSAASLPLPSGAATSAKQPALGTAGSSSTDVLSVQGIASGTALPVSAASLPLPSGASTLAEQQTQTTALQLIDDSISTTGSAVPAKGVQATGTDGTNARALKTDSSGELQIDVLTVPTDPFGANADAASATGSISAKLRFIASTGIPITGTVTVGSHAVTNAGTFAVQVDGAALTALQLIDNIVLAEDAGHQSGDPGVQMLTVRQNTAAALSNSDADYQPLITDTNGRLHVIEPSAATTATNTGNAATSLGVMDDWDNAASDGASVSGDVAHGSSDAGEPVKIGAKAETSPKGITVVTDGQRTDLYADSDGMQMVKLNTSGADFIQERTTNTDGNSTAFSTFGAAANLKNVVTALSIFRTDSGTSLIYLDFRDGTGGSVIWSVPIPPSSGVVLNGGGMPIFKQPTANTALAYDVSAATTTVIISISGYQTKV